MPATAQSLRDLLGGLDGVSDDSLTQILADAQAEVENHLSSDSDHFARLHRYYAAHLLMSSGLYSGPVASEAVGDVNVSYSGQDQSKGPVAWYQMFQSALVAIIGMEHRFGC